MTTINTPWAIGKLNYFISICQLTARFGVARGTVAKGVRVLRDEGLVFIVVGRGAWVTPKSERAKRKSQRPTG